MFISKAMSSELSGIKPPHHIIKSYKECSQVIRNDILQLKVLEMYKYLKLVF